ncbi:DMT family transporter [Methyloraptor flagellatus]|uniref:DMT family transporter n=1 Tax=Methyloraptor flagellatus TaxID=3162530 RepID=A0AAU7X9S1_9HYPH
MASLDVTEAVPERPRARNLRLEGIGLICLALFLFSLLDTSAKWLTRHDLPPIQVTFVRYGMAFLVAGLVFNPVRAPHAWRMSRPWLQVFRAAVLFGSTIFNFLALRKLQLAETMSITFATPFLIALVAGRLLGETVGLKRWAAIVVGFLGVLVVTRPGGGFDPAMLWTFAAVLCYAAYAITTRMLSGVDSSASMLIFSALMPVVAMAPFLPGFWVWPSSGFAWAVLLDTGVLGAVGHFFLIMAYARAPASVIAPFTYTQIVWMVLFGYLVFGDVPGLATLAGASIVIASGLYLLYCERAERQAARRSAS